MHRLVGGRIDLFLKRGEGPAAEFVHDEAARLRWLAGRISAPRLIETTMESGAVWLLTEALPGRSADEWLADHRDGATRLARSMAAFLCRLHSLAAEDCPFDSSVATWLPVARRLVADGQVDTEDFEPEHRGWSAADVLEVVEALAGHAGGQVVVHGDYSLGNLIVDEAGDVTGCIDIGRLGVGDPYRDIVIGWRDLAIAGRAAKQAFLSAFGFKTLDADRSRLHLALDELF